MSGSSQELVRSVLRPPFLVAVGLLLCSALLAGPVASVLGYTRIKQRLELKAELNTLQVEKLAPYALRRVGEHDGKVLLRREILDALGTNQYLSWKLEDTALPSKDPLRFVDLNVTYYSGGHNLVPHTPEACMVGGGYNPVRLEYMDVHVPGLGLADDRLPVRVCTFGRTKVFNEEQFEVVYTFYCNGRYVATRDAVRVLLNNPKDRYAFFSKVEVSFPGATREDSVRGTEKLLARVLPVLMEDHWPDFEAAERAANASPEKAGPGGAVSE
jgi:hypothetical protein